MPASRTRAVVVWSSFVLAVAGWGGSLWSWLDHGLAAGVHPGFIMALTVACTFSVTFTVAFVMPDKVRLFGLGVEEGIRLAGLAQRDPEPGAREPRRHLSVAP
jgi:hypothetical protein